MSCEACYTRRRYMAADPEMYRGDDRRCDAHQKIASQAQRIEELEDLVPHPGDGSCDRCGCVPSVAIPTALCDECLKLLTSTESLQAQNAELKEKNEQLEHNKAYYVRQFLKALQCKECSATRRARLQAGIDESVKGMSQEELDTIIAELAKPFSEDELLTDEEIENTRLKKEIATLRATAELVETALRDYVLAQSRMSERWAAGDKAVKHQLWRDLHVCEALGREALEALEALKNASAAHPAANPRSSGGSGT